MNRGKLLASRYRRKVALQQHDECEDGTQVERKDKASNPQKVSQRPTASKAAKKTEDNKFDKALRDFVTKTVEIGVPGLCQEFVTIKTETQGIGKASKEAFDAHGDKNRYKDVYCVDETRVILKWPPGRDDYIHANWVNCQDAKGKFICTQAPTDKSIEEFWRMMWQEKCKSIVMLCNLIEQGKKKCEQYWPATQGETMDAGCIKITNNGMKDVEQTLTLTKLDITDGKDTMQVEHLIWNNWPDRGVPDNFLACFRLLNRVKDLTPIVVHCSAGIGRTGTIVGLHILHTRLLKGDVCTIDKIVRELRESRHGSVQMDIQYVYMHRVMIALAENKKLVGKEELHQWMTDYDTLCKARGC